MTTPLADLRRERDWTQVDLAAAVGVHPNTVTRWEMDGRWAARPAGPTLRYLAHLLGVEPDEIAFGVAGRKKQEDRP